MTEKLTIEGIVENIIYTNKENGYSVFCIYSEDYMDIFQDTEIICVGYVPNINEGENIKVVGTQTKHPTYGTQIKIELYEKSIPKTEKGIQKYLASGLIKGIGSKIAEKIIKKFGVNSLEIIEKTPEKLSEIRGISVQKAMEIGEIFSEQNELRNSIIFLQEHNISTNLAIKIFNHYKNNTIKNVKNNPYSLVDEIFGVSFKIADKIAKKIGIEKDSPYRIKAGIKFILNQNSNVYGNVYLPEQELIKEAVKILEVDEEIVIFSISSLNIERQICMEKSDLGNIIFLHSYFYAENFVAKKILELSDSKVKYNPIYDTWLKNIEDEKNIKLALNQKNAIKEAMVNGVLVITGGPGTGKTTTINSIIKMLKNEGYDIELCAPTGRAAKKMTETTGIEAQTIHRLLGVNYVSENNKRQNFNKDEDNPLETDVVIVDECSMIDILLMSKLLSAIANGTRLILVGDVDQLPSIGAGNVLKDIINSNCIKVVRLNEIFRQAQQSAIVMNAHRINKGEYPTLNEKDTDFFLLKKYDTEEIIKTVVELISKRLPKFLNLKNSKEIQIICPMRKSPVGIINLNCVLQNALNPPSNNKNEKQVGSTLFREGDKVMQIKNNYNMVWKMYNENIFVEEGVGIFNGDEGIIKSIDIVKEIVEVVFDECKIVKYEFNQLDELDLSYAITTHKSQGSEYKAVIIPLHSGSKMLLTRNLLYTGVTRAKELVVIVGIPETLNKMVDNNSEINRYTYLKNRIINLYEFKED